MALLGNVVVLCREGYFILGLSHVTQFIGGGVRSLCCWMSQVAVVFYSKSGHCGVRRIRSFCRRVDQVIVLSVR